MAQDFQGVNLLSMRGFQKTSLTSGTITLKEDIRIWSSSSHIASSSDEDFSVSNVLIWLWPIVKESSSTDRSLMLLIKVVVNLAKRSSQSL